MRRAFTLIEVLIAIGIIGMVSGVTIPMYYRYMSMSELDNATSILSQQLGRAKTLAQSGENNTSWGVSVSQGAIVLFEGASYATRNAASDETYPLPDTITFGGIPEVTFSRMDGTPSVTGEMTLLNVTGDQREVEITLNMEGIQTNDNDTITICHKPGQDNQTMTINDNAWPGHQGHGDTLGACTGAASSMNSSASSAASGGGGSASSSDNKVHLCHSGNTIYVNKSACEAHVSHGDLVGECPGSGTDCPDD